MKNGYLIIFILIFGNLFCQNSDLLKAKTEFEKYISNSDSTKFQDIKNQKFQNIIEFSRFEKLVNREIDFGLSEIIYSITFNYISEIHYVKIQDLTIHFYYFDKKYVGKIIAYKQYKNMETQNIFDFKSDFQKFIDKHNSFYKTNLSKKEFIEDSLLNTVYGNYCGYSGEKYLEKYNTELEKIENAEKYVEWMKSFNLEKQMWGYDQIQYLLKNNLIELESEEQKIYNHIRKRNAIIEMCSGCTFGIFEKTFKNN